MRRLPLAAAALALLLLGQAAQARPGGGGGYSGGGSRGGSSSGRSSGAGSSSTTTSGGSRSSGGGWSGGASRGDDSFDTNREAIRSTPGDARAAGFWFGLLLVPIGLFLAGGLIVRLSSRRQDGNDDDGGGLRIPSAAADDEPARVGPPPTLDAIVARDPALTFASIEARVHRMNEILRAAWCSGDMRSARPFVSDGVYGRFRVQLALMKGEGRRNVMADAQLLDVELQDVDASGPFDVVHVRLTARARDTDVPWDAGERAVAHALEAAPLERYEEIWSLVRRQGARTSRDASGLGRECRSCGAPLETPPGVDDAEAQPRTCRLGETIRCRYCGVLLCSGEHDWVLAEITQVSEWHPMMSASNVLREMRARDPELAREALEDRASFLFWKWIEAGRLRSPAPLRKHATAPLLATPATLQGLADLRDVAVGAVDLLRVEPGALDAAYVRVFWSAKQGAGARAEPARSVLRLVRKPGATARASMTSLVCGACGAPVGESDTPTCDHCGAQLAGGDHAWVLDAVER